MKDNNKTLIDRKCENRFSTQFQNDFRGSSI